MNAYRCGRVSGWYARSQDRRARMATTAVFFVTGFVVAAWATRIPAIQQRLALSPGSFAVAILGLEGGALVGLPVGGALTARLGSRRSLRPAFAVYPTALPAVALAPGLGWLLAALAVMAAANSVVDVAMSVQGVELERRYRRPILSGLHAAHPLVRLAGDRLVARCGRLRVVQASGLVAAAGAALVVAAPTAIPSLLGWATMGAGLAAIAPAILGAVPAAARGPLPVAIAAVTTLGYLGSFTGPPLVGALAELTGLTRALGLLVVAALVPVLLARRALDPRTVGERQPSLR
jgi:MFS family permease